jgi:hydrogenase expression/formation protein HypD
MARTNKNVDPAQIVRNYSGPPLRIMEVCGTHTHEIFKLGIRDMLPAALQLIPGPGCPVCVTPATFIDEALLLALEYGATICTFGDLVRVPGGCHDLAQARAKGAKLQIVYSPLDAVDYAAGHQKEKVIFLSIGFETTVPASCLALKQAEKAGLKNFWLLAANKTMDQAYPLLADGVDVFLYPGHVSAITGMEVYKKLKLKGISGVVTGFTAAEILAALAVISKKAASKEPFASNCYPRIVTEEGNIIAKGLIKETMIACDAIWRGLGLIKNSGLCLAPAYEQFDARKAFDLPTLEESANPDCRCGDILRGLCSPPQCPLFGGACRPENPLGACMVSNEGTCAAFYKYGGLLWKK